MTGGADNSSNNNDGISALFPSGESQLKSRLKNLRELLPLALEQVRAPDQAAMAALAESIETAQDSKEVINLAHTMTSRQLDLVFPLLAAVSIAKAPDKDAVRQAEQLTDRLFLIVRERACPSLYESGWFKYQTCYPCPPIGQALALVCRIIEIKKQTHPAAVPEALDAKGSGLVMISQIAAPNSRHFIARLCRELQRQRLSPEEFAARHSIHLELPLGSALLVEYFMSDDITVFENRQKLFGLAASHAGSSDQALLLHHFFGLKKLPDTVRNKYCQQIYKVFDDPAADHPVWSEVKSKDRQAFQDWVRSATIGTHCRQRPDKARLYLTYSDDIMSVDHWDADTLLIYFRDFIIADSRLHPDLANCYSRTGVGNPFELAGGDFNPNPADPAIPSRSVEDAVRRSDFSGTIGLPFDHDGIRLTSVFLELRLNHRSRRRLLPFGN